MSKKPTNKERDSAISHIFQRMTQVEHMVQTSMDLFEHFVDYTKQRKKFTDYLEKKHKEALNEQEKLRQENESAVPEDKKDARQRAERVR